LRANPGSPFIAAFIVSLLSTAVLLVSSRAGEANNVANYAFYSLIVGILVQIGVVVREERKRTRAARDSPSQKG